MYNGIGLPTPRGSGTSGYVQRNLSHVREKPQERKAYDFDSSDASRFEATLTKKPNKEILEHERKRNIEVKCIEMQDLMEEQGYLQFPLF